MAAAIATAGEGAGSGSLAAWKGFGVLAAGSGFDSAWSWLPSVHARTLGLCFPPRTGVEVPTWTLLLGGERSIGSPKSLPETFLIFPS